MRYLTSIFLILILASCSEKESPIQTPEQLYGVWAAYNTQGNLHLSDWEIGKDRVVRTPPLGKKGRPDIWEITTIEIEDDIITIMFKDGGGVRWKVEDINNMMQENPPKPFKRVVGH